MVDEDLGQQESDQCDLDLFGDEEYTEEETEALAAVRERLAAARVAARAAISKEPSNRSAAESRLLYTTDKALRREVVISEEVFSAAECAQLIVAAEASATARGGWFSARHSAYPTTDIPVDMVPALADFVHAVVSARVVAAAAAHRGFLAEQLGVRDMFFVKYQAGQQAGLAEHTDGSIISFKSAPSPPRPRHWVPQS
jgi:hypothetical protein